MKRIIIAASLICSPLLVNAESSDERVMELIQKVLAEKPELVKTALLAQREKEQKEVISKQSVIINEHRKTLYEGKFDHRAGNPKGDVSIIMLHDFRCGHCITAKQRVKAYLQDEKNVNVIFKDFPILGPDSKFAARASLAAHKQGVKAQNTFINKLSSASGRIDDDDVIRIAKEAKLDVARLEKDMDSKEIWKELGNTKAAARRLGVRSTPTFIIGAKGKEKLMTGVLEKGDLMDIVAKARKA